MTRNLLRFLAAVVAAVLVARAADAACVNRFVRRTESGTRQVVTFLTGKLTIDEAKALSEAINSKKSAPLEWVDDGGRTIARQFGEMKVVRPMPVGCDGRTSGVVLIVTFMSSNSPTKKMNVKLDANTLVAFDEQAE
jgi:hypothetical protein